MADSIINGFTKGIYNILDSENIPKDAGYDTLNWYTSDGRIKLINGRIAEGDEGTVGKIYAEIFGYKINGTKIHWRKADGKIQYLNAGTWTDVVTGLTATADYTFANYSSLAGTFTYAFGIDGIYKMHNANPGSFMAMYDSAINFKGYALIDRGRTILWNRPEDKTGLYGSYIDRQNSTVYTQVTAEVLGASGSTTYSGTLAFKGATLRNCFGLTVSGVTGGGTETFTDNYLGVLTGSLGGTGTINYLTGVYSVTFNGVVTSGNVTANYQWENSNANGITDFRKSATRLAGEGFVFPQDEGGDAIVTVKIGQDGSYYSLKSQSAYQLTLDETDTNATNIVYRRDIGVPFLRSAVSTGKGIVFINTANQSRPELTILQRNPLGDNIEPVILFPHFKFSNYTYEDSFLDTYDRYIIVGCKSSGAVENNRILLCNLSTGTVDITGYNARTSAKDETSLYVGSPLTKSIYKIYDGFDDDSLSIDNFWISKNENFQSEKLKKSRYIYLKGLIDPDQYYEVYAGYDNAGFQLVGTVRGDGNYVDQSSPQSIGGNIIGSEQIGGSDEVTVYPYFCPIKIRAPKYRVRQLKLKALGIGYVDVEFIEDHDILIFENRLPARFRTKQYVSLDGTETDLDTPQF